MMMETVDKGITLWSKVGLAFLVGWMGSSISHQTAVTDKATSALHIVQTQVVPKLKAEAGCEHWRAETNKKLALQSQMVLSSQIPLDCPHPKK